MISADWTQRWCHYERMLSLEISFKCRQLVCFQTVVLWVRCRFAPFAAAHGISFSCSGSLTKAPWCSGICELKSSRASRHSSRKWTRRNQVSPTRSNTWTARGNLCSGWLSRFTLCQSSVKTVFLLKCQWIVRCISLVQCTNSVVVTFPTAVLHFFEPPHLALSLPSGTSVTCT